MAGDSENLYAFEDEDAFDRNARVMRWAEMQMAGVGGEEGIYRPAPNNAVSVRITGPADGGFCPAIITYKDASNGKWYDLEECLAYDLNDADLEEDKRYKGNVVGTDPAGNLIVEVQVGGGAGGYFPVRISSGSDGGGYGFVEVYGDGSGNFPDLPDGRTGTAFRHPSNLAAADVPDIPVGQFSLCRPDPETADAFDVLAWGGVNTVSGTIGPYLTDVTLETTAAAVCNSDKTITVTVTNTLTKTYGEQTVTIKARDITMTLPAVEEV